MDKLITRIGRIPFYIEMGNFTVRVIQQKIWNKRNKRITYRNQPIIDDKQVDKLLAEKIISEKPLMIGRFGSTELRTVNQYLRRTFGISRDYSKNVYESIYNLSGVFPASQDILDRFAFTYLESLANIDVLAAWNTSDIEGFLFKKIAPKDAKLISLDKMDPYFSDIPWTGCLEGKKILIIHPFKDTIQKQYEKRSKLFINQKILPEFEGLVIIKAIQSLGGSSEFKDWFDALSYMKKQMDSVDYDIALIGAGAYGLPLAAYAKSKGKMAIHMGGMLQLLFGIRGGRWDTQPKFQHLFNEHWVRPSENERPQNYKAVEGACYW